MGEQVIEGIGDQRTVADRDERLGPPLGEGAQARAQTGAEDEGGAKHGASCSRQPGKSNGIIGLEATEVYPRCETREASQPETCA